jgi:hypothetical protein
MAANHRPGATPLEVMAVLWAELIGVTLQHWLLLTAAWTDDCRSLLKAARATRLDQVYAVGLWNRPIAGY